MVRELIKRKFGVDFTPQGVGKLLRRLGLSPQRPLVRAYEQDPERVRAWKEEVYPAIQAEARAAGASIFFGDEAAVRTDHHAGTTWAPVEVTTDKAGPYLRVLDELVPAAAHVTEQYANNRIEADHGRLKARLRPMRGLKLFRSASVIAGGHAFVQNLRRGHYELATNVPAGLRLAVAFAELALAV